MRATPSVSTLPVSRGLLGARDPTRRPILLKEDARVVGSSDRGTCVRVCERSGWSRGPRRPTAAATANPTATTTPTPTAKPAAKRRRRTSRRIAATNGTAQVINRGAARARLPQRHTRTRKRDPRTLQLARRSGAPRAGTLNHRLAPLRQGCERRGVPGVTRTASSRTSPLSATPFPPTVAAAPKNAS